MNLKKFTDSTYKRLREIPLLLDSFTISLSWDKSRAHQDFHHLLSSASMLHDDDYEGGGSNRSTLKVVLRNPNHYMGFVDGRMFLNYGPTKFLHLNGCALHGLQNSKTCLANLWELNLDVVRVSKESIQSFLANALFLEKLILKRITRIYNFDISASNFLSLIFVSVYAQPLDGLIQVQLTSVPHPDECAYEYGCV
ncbi:hypothetical protein LINPERPRIM_LOCUS21786 [Linum perenne]